MELSEIAERALFWLDRDGWGKYEFGEIGQPHCAGGALNLALHGAASEWADFVPGVYEKMAGIIAEQWPDIVVFPDSVFPDSVFRFSRGLKAVWTIALWNDDPRITEEDVRVLFGKLVVAG